MTQWLFSSTCAAQVALSSNSRATDGSVAGSHRSAGERRDQAGPEVGCAQEASLPVFPCLLTFRTRRSDVGRLYHSPPRRYRLTSPPLGRSCLVHRVVLPASATRRCRPSPSSSRLLSARLSCRRGRLCRRLQVFGVNSTEVRPTAGVYGTWGGRQHLMGQGGGERRVRWRYC